MRAFILGELAQRIPVFDVLSPQAAPVIVFVVLGGHLADSESR